MRTKRASQLHHLAVAIDGFGQDIRDELIKGKLVTDEQIQIGAQLIALVKKSNSLLDVLKAHLREMALQQNTKPGTQHFNAGDGSRCTVTVPKSALAVKKGADIDGLRPILEGLFDSLFETVKTHKPRKEFKTRVASCSPAQKQAVTEVVEIKENTPRVSFKR